MKRHRSHFLFWRIFVHGLLLIVAVTVIGGAAMHFLGDEPVWSRMHQRVGQLVEQEIDKEDGSLAERLEEVAFVFDGAVAVYRNDGERFTDVANEAGIVDPGFGMGVSFGDYDNDGDLDLHVTNMSSTAGNRILKLLYPEGHQIRETLSKQAAGNSLYENRGDGTFRDVTETLGGLSGGWAFGGGFLDYDNDGWEDIYTPNGFVSGKTMNDT